VTVVVELRERLRRYYTAYYRDTLGIPDWATLVELRQREEQQEAEHLERVRRLVGAEALRGRVLSVGCGTGGFSAVATAAGACMVGVDEDAEAIAICRLRDDAGHFVRAAAEALPFRDGTFDLVYCFSVIEHVDSVETTIAEMTRVTRPGGQLYVHTPNAGSWYEGHFKLFWIPFLPPSLGRLYLRLRGRPPGYLATIRRLTPGRLTRAFRRVGVTALRRLADSPPRESVGPAWPLIRIYYRWLGVTPFIELLAEKPVDH
jgi:SAM-dependent methyltransferase